MTTDTTANTELREQVRDRYRQSALRVLNNEGGCCSSASSAGDCCGSGNSSAITSDLYSALEAQEVPSAAVLASLGCGNPTALAELHPGETVLDLGSGGGIDVFLSAKRVGPTGTAIGLDMTDEMLALADANRVLKPGGRFAVSDVVRRGEAPEAILRSLEAWTGCIAGALHEDVYRSLLAEAGFTDIGIAITRSYTNSLWLGYILVAEGQCDAV